MKEAMLKDLELQWKDHQHMHNQAWKSLYNSLLVLLGIVGLEIKELDDIIMIPAYCVLGFLAFVGYKVTAHLRKRQRQKFVFIKKYEEKLGLYELKQDTIESESSNSGRFPRILTTGLIEVSHVGIIIIAVLLLVKRILSI